MVHRRGDRGLASRAPDNQRRPGLVFATAILTALTLKAVFHLALRQTEGLIGSIIAFSVSPWLVPDRSTLSRRAETLDVPRPRSGIDAGSESMHLLVGSTGLKLCGAGEWLVEKHGTKTRRSWRKLHIGMDDNSGEIVAAALTTNEVDDACQIGPLLDQVTGPVASFTGDGAYDQDSVHRAVIDRDPDAVVIVPPRSTAVPSVTGETEPTRPPSPAHCRERPDGVAEGVRLQHAQPGRSRHRALQAGDW
ncbi:MAG: hypothetical protein QOD93_7173 [Acetobacteraceae bacterium]|nr:hypothetical protein [Acetobacteraceae bacterium]